MKFNYLTILSCITAGLVCSCGDDVGYTPAIPGDFTVFEVEDQISSKVEYTSMSVSVVLNENQTPSDLTIRKVKLSEGARCHDPEIADGKKIDLSSPKTVTLSTYKDFTWTIDYRQPVNRYAICENQVGEAAIHPESKTISVYVKIDNTSYIDSRTRLKILDMKLEREGSRIISTTDLNGETLEITRFPITLDCFYQRTFTVDDHGVKSDWRFIALPAK